MNYGGDYGSVKSLLDEDKSCKSNRPGVAVGEEQLERSELSKKRHLPKTEVLINQGVPEHEALRQIDELLLNLT